MRISACFSWEFCGRLSNGTVCCCFVSLMKEQLFSMLMLCKIFSLSVSLVNASGAAVYFWLFLCCFYVQ